MKTKRFLLSAMFFAASLAFFACSSDSSDSVGDNVVNQDDDSSPSVIVHKNFLGVGYDVIKSGYINALSAKSGSPVLDVEKMVQDAIIDSTSLNNVQKFETFTGKSIKQFYQERNAGINVSYAGDGISSFFFSGNFKGEFSNASNEEMKESIYYSRMRSYRYTQDHYIKNPTAANLSKYLTESFISSLQTMSASNLLDLYGTHVFIRYYKGGSLEANYTYTGTKLTSNNQVKTAVEASFGGISGSGNYSNTTDKNELESNMSFKYYAYGGRAVNSTDWSGLKNEYGSWVNSITTNADICGIPDNFSDGLMPIWELASAVGQSSKATQLQNEFRTRATQQGIALPLARKYKTADYIHRSSSGTSTVSLQPPAGGTIAEIEIYALGAGGGGQGGNQNGTISVARGTGGAGGGGSAAYLKLSNLELNKNESVSLSVTIGSGGAGGNQHVTGLGTFADAGCSGKNGGTTTVSWNAKSIALNASGGSGGGSGSTSCGGNNVNGGAGGTGGTVNPSSSILYADKSFVSGSKGSNGNIDYGESPMASSGGNAAIISRGTLSSFGGGSGSIRAAGSSTRSTAQNGGGGTSGHMNQAGLSGGGGLVTIVYKYYIEE